MFEALVISIVIGLFVAFACLVQDSLHPKYPYLSFFGITLIWPLGLAALIVLGVGYTIYQIGREIGLLLKLIPETTES